MSLYVYSGVPGSGKTYHAVSDMVDNPSCPCITNISVCGLGNVATIPLEKITPDLLTSFSSFWFSNEPYKENSIFLILDECQLLFNNRRWNEPNRLEWLAFFSQHRKYGYKVILICQSIDLIDKSFRCLCEFDIRHTSSGSVSLLTRFIHQLGGKYTCAKTYFFEQEELISRKMYGIREKVYKHYDTNQDIVCQPITSDIMPIVSQLDFKSGASASSTAPLAARRGCGFAALKNIVVRIKHVLKTIHGKS